MKKVTYCLIALFITLLVSVATLEAATEITKLPWTITTQGSYIINQNLKANWHGIKVQANNVTIDLNGYSIAGNNASGGYGVYMSGCSNVEIRNGTIRNFGSHGIYEESSSGNSHRVISVRVMNNKGYGIFLYGSNHMVKDCNASNNVGTGIYADSSSCAVSGNTVYSNAWGIFAGNGSMVSGNTAYDNIGHGIYATNGCTVSGNTAHGNGEDGIYATNGCTVSGNTAHGNGEDGIFVDSGSTVKNNTAYSNQHFGIYSVGYNLVDGNAAYNNNQAQGGYTNINSTCVSCTFGVNSAP
jgi:parallel beta-helix repeat protein